MSATTQHGSDDRFTRASEVFRRSWSLYEKVVQSNSMRHREMEQSLHALLRQISHPCSMLDLGCGDAGMVSRALSGTAVREYTGVELVETAAEIAKQRMAGVVSQASFEIANLIDAVQRPFPVPFDVVLASYAVHHLSLEEKARLFHDIRRLIKPDGMFLLIDLMLCEEEGREEYLSRFDEFAVTHWGTLTNEERLEVREHMHASDWPESLATFQRLGSAAGFGAAEVHYRDPEQFYALLRFRAGA